jgi:predicted CXXCH cytochrome family protein
MRLRHLIGAICIAALGAEAAAGAVQDQTIAGTPHDLRALATRGAGADPCAFCHVPDAAGDGPPGWNRDAPAGTFLPYASATLKATPGAPSGVSAGCLSCHDGLTPLDALRAPGNIVLIVPGQTMADAYPGSTAILGRDLGNHHPASIGYGGAGGSGDPAFVAPTRAGSRVYVTSVSDGAAIPLFGAAPGTVECASCHDPHDNANGKLLRTVNTGSALCLACHNS